MGCCGQSSTSPGPTHMGFASTADGQVRTSAAAPWRVTFRDGRQAWYSDQLVAYAEAGVNGGAVDYIPAGAGGGTVIPAQ